MSEKVKREEELDRLDRNFGGLLLVGIGVLVFLLNLARSEVLGLLILPVLGLSFLAWGFYTRRFGFVIPGCILTGLGVGTFLTQRAVFVSESAPGGIVVLGLAAGFIAMTFIAPFFEGKRMLWPLIPGGILGIVGLLLVIGGEAINVLEWLGTIWPLVLVAVGLYVLFWPREREE